MLEHGDYWLADLGARQCNLVIELLKPIVVGCLGNDEYFFARAIYLYKTHEFLDLFCQMVSSLKFIGSHSGPLGTVDVC